MAGTYAKYADFTIQAFCFQQEKHWVHASMVMRFDISGLKKTTPNTQYGRCRGESKKLMKPKSESCMGLQTS